MPSQFGDKDSWQGSTMPNVPTHDDGSATYILGSVKKRNVAVAEQYRAADCATGAEREKKIQYAEAFGSIIRAPAVDGRTEAHVPAK